MTTLLAFIFAILVLVFIHEYGHYRVAVACSVKVLRFSIGFGPVLWEKTDKRGVQWTLCALPLGGYVRMLDENEEKVAKADLPFAFNQKPVWQRALIVAAGPVANLIAAVVFLSVLSWVGVSDWPAKISYQAPQNLLSQAGLTGGEEIKGIQVADKNYNIRSWSDVDVALIDAWLSHQPVRLELLGLNSSSVQEVEIQLPPISNQEEINIGKLRQMGFSPSNTQVLIERVEADGAAAAAGIVAGDQIIAIDKQHVIDSTHLIALIAEKGEQARAIVVMREGAEWMFNVTPQKLEVNGKSVYRLGVLLGSSRIKVQRGFFEGMAYGWQRMAEMSVLTLKVLGGMVTGSLSVTNISGPIMVAQVAGVSAQAGVEAFIHFLAVVSVSLGVLNLLPIPVLDGGQLVYLSIEALRGRSLSSRVVLRLQQLGVACLLMLMSVAVFNDISRLLH